MILTALDTINDIASSKLDQTIRNEILDMSPASHIGYKIGLLSKWQPQEFNSVNTLTKVALWETSNDN
jgi:hypothetical protein